MGVAGFVAPRHLEAIKVVGGKVVAALDPHDSVGILDRYGRDIAFFTEPERFERYLHKHAVDYLTVCSPNYLHDAHIRMGLLAGCNVICEKPLVLNPENLNVLQELERKTNRRVWTVLQLRFQGERLRQTFEKGDHGVHMRYITPRGRWYHHSWKADPNKSGGLVTNIGIHMFDLLLYLFGPVEHAEIEHRTEDEIKGILRLARAQVVWHLSIRGDAEAERTFDIDGTPINLSGSFDSAHTKVYEEILAGRGFGIEDARPAIKLCWRLRQPSG